MPPDAVFSTRRVMALYCALRTKMQTQLQWIELVTSHPTLLSHMVLTLLAHRDVEHRNLSRRVTPSQHMQSTRGVGVS